MADAGTAPGRNVVRASWYLTGLLLVGAGFGVWRPDDLGVGTAAISILLFAVGVVAFLWAYAHAVRRSRTELIGIGGVYFLAGSAPAAVRRALLGSFGTQVVIAVTAASIRPFTDVAFAILAPLAGLGLAGLWGGRHGTFPPRPAPSRGPGAVTRRRTPDPSASGD